MRLDAIESRVQCYPMIHDNCFWGERNKNEGREKGRKWRGREEEMSGEWKESKRVTERKRDKGVGQHLSKYY